MTIPDKQASGNLLRGEKSPYLLQHALNPVAWRPWGEEAFATARGSDRPLFISIGYSTCHWCHVMERESFEDQDVARLLNENFIPVKVDREERPDIDRLYMSACTLLTGSGGWPLTVIATPDGKPFFSGTYFPRQGRFGRPGLLDLLPRIAEIWRSRREEVLLSVNEIAEALSTLTLQARGTEPGVETMDRAFEYFDGAFDSEHGGFGQAPKFPTPHNLSFLLRYWRRSGKPEALAMVERTLDSLCQGGICDHLGGGFHRYSTDSRWQVPHFEKMLYDQALIAIALLEAFQATGKERYASAARRTFEYVLRDLATPEGGLYCAEDADSEGEEGRFYLWSAAEVRRVLGPEHWALAFAAWNIKESGNYHDEASGAQSGLNILFRERELSKIAEETGIPLPELETRLEKARQALFEERGKRVRPFLDTKVLADWNGLIISALARGARVLDSPEYARAAARAAEFILLKMRDSRGGLLHRWCGGEAAVPGLADDYAFMVQGMIDLYEATFQNKWLREAINLNALMLDLFRDDKDGGGLFFSAVCSDTLPLRQKELHDGATPSANSVAALNLLRLARMTGDSTLELKAREIFRVFSGSLERNPMAFCQALCSLDFALGPNREIVLAGTGDPETARPFIRALWPVFEPGRVVLFHSMEDEFSLTGIAPFTRGMNPPEGKDIAAFVCRDGACSLPVTEPAGLGESAGR